MSQWYMPLRFRSEKAWEKPQNTVRMAVAGPHLGPKVLDPSHFWGRGWSTQRRKRLRCAIT